MMSLLTVILSAPMLAVAALGLPLLIVMCVCGAQLLKKAPRVKRVRVRERMKKCGIAHFVIEALSILMIPMSMVSGIAIYACAAGALLMAAGGIALGCSARRYRASHAAAVTQIIFGVLFAVLLAGILAVVQFKMHINIF